MHLLSVGGRSALRWWRALLLGSAAAAVAAAVPATPVLAGAAGTPVNLVAAKAAAPIRWRSQAAKSRPEDAVIYPRAELLEADVSLTPGGAAGVAPGLNDSETGIRAVPVMWSRASADTSNSDQLSCRPANGTAGAGTR